MTTVYRAGSGAQTTGLTLHLRRDCPRLQHANSILSKDLAVFADPEFCSRCGDSDE